MQPSARKSEILDAALRVAAASGFAAMRQQDIATEAKCSYGTVSTHFTNMRTMRRAVMRAAIERKILLIIAQGLAAYDSDARKAPQALRKAALATLSN